MHSYIANPLSTKDIRSIANNLRKKLGLCTKDDKNFPIVEFLELIMPKIIPEFHLSILEKNEMRDIHGLACPQEHCIKIREDVYEKAAKGFGRDRFTLAHELGHYIMHNSNSIRLARLGDTKSIEAFRNPEWQANTFAAELLMPIDLMDEPDPFIIADEFGVSYEAARIRVKKIYKL